jgi:hypothetical protein
MKKKKNKTKVQVTNNCIEVTNPVPLSMSLDENKFLQLKAKGYSNEQATSVLYREMIAEMFEKDERLN